MLENNELEAVASYKYISPVDAGSGEPRDAGLAAGEAQRSLAWHTEGKRPLGLGWSLERAQVLPSPPQGWHH